MNSTQLFNSLRSMFQGHLSQTQVDCTNAIITQCVKHEISDVHQIAYILATGVHECGLKPIEESITSRNGKFYNIPDKNTGQIYYGRGCPTQITLKANYATFARLLGIDLINNPDLALNIDYGAEIGVIGMKVGLFTGVGLSKYFTPTSQDPVNARKIINGLDCAQLISGYYSHILDGLI